MSRPGTRREGWGSAEATEMVLNNLFYITAKVRGTVVFVFFALDVIDRSISYVKRCVNLSP
jgi:hypothetical protein